MGLQLWILSGNNELQLELSHSARELEKREPAVSRVAAQSRKSLQEGLLARLLLPRESLLQRLAEGPIQSASMCAHRNQLVPWSCVEVVKYVSALRRRHVPLEVLLFQLQGLLPLVHLLRLARHRNCLLMSRLVTAMSRLVTAWPHTTHLLNKRPRTRIVALIRRAHRPNKLQCLFCNVPMLGRWGVSARAMPCTQSQ